MRTEDATAAAMLVSMLLAFAAVFAGIVLYARDCING